MFMPSVLMILPFVCFSNGLPRVIKLGGLFETDEEEQETVFDITVKWINEDRYFFPRSTLVAYKESHESDNSFEVSKKVCKLLSFGMAGIFGPQSPASAAHVQSITDALEVPHIETRWDYRHKRDHLSINLYPPPSLLNQAYIDIVKKWGWQSFIIIYEENEGIIRVQDFLKQSPSNNWKIQVHKFLPEQPYRNLFRQIRASFAKWPDKDICILLDVSKKQLFNVLKQAQQVEMMTVRNKYILTSLDLHTLDLEDFQYSRANITGFKIVNTESEVYEALLYETKDRMRSVGISNLKAISKWLRGLTGRVRFDGQGFRSTFDLDVMQLTTKGLKKIGYVLPGRDVNITDVFEIEDISENQFEHKKYIITTILNKPFAMLRNSPRQLSGNDRYEGFTIDFIEELSKQLHFSYEIREVADKKYGVEVDKQKGIWNGMIGEVLQGVADMAVADLTITSTREKVLDFSLPFMNTGISILFKKPTEKVKSLFSFLSPFSSEVWIYVVAAFLGVSFVLFLVGRLSPYEWENVNPCRQDERIQENSFNILNSMWFTIASVMQQGCEVTPRSSSTRTVSSIWYFFTLIMISSYTANLAAFLTVEKVVYPIESAKDLSQQTKIKYGCLASGSTRAFFESSSISTYERMWKFMQKHPEVLMESNEKGKEKVYAGNYAYLMESASIQFLTERECNLTQIGGLLDHKGYGIATKKGNKSLSDWLTGGILKLQESGVLHTLKERWWKQKRGGGQCVEVQSGTVRELGLRNVGGVFVVLLIGILLAAAVASLEFLWTYRKYTASQEDIGKLMMKDIKFAITCSSSVKEAPRYKRKRFENSRSTMSDVTEVKSGYSDLSTK
ncbi:glutamate receptor ionotropic, kainate 2-like isoform X2 [Stegodyphus dumicola]|uniref:glutamate receptor ionotropic, kainate 2-like isoform X2 n=1 Tax=Stegodyphus dumicola TaxID=202533 RepID=UPI0015B00828|nr:glutamate receptor ionotropic, kainate 2-like isoform X2 [Stegodyphus dumicola]